MVVASLKEKKTHSKHFTSKLKSHTSIQGFFSSFLITSDLNNAGADPGFFFRRGCTRLLLYFNTNKTHSFSFGRIPVVLENRRCAPPAPSP